MEHPLEKVFNMNNSTTIDEVQYEILDPSEIESYDENIESIKKDMELSNFNSSAISPLNNTPAAIPDVKDEEDIDTDKKILEIYDIGLKAYKDQMQYLEYIEPRYAAKNAEVASNFLKIALDAINSKAKNKNERKRTNSFGKMGNNFAGAKNTTNVIVADRNDLLKSILSDENNNSNNQ